MSRSLEPQRDLREAWWSGIFFTVVILAILGLVAAVGTYSDSLHDQAIADVNTIEAHIHAQSTTIARQAMTITLQAETISDAEIRRLDQEDMDRDRVPNPMDADTDADGKCNVGGEVSGANPGHDVTDCAGEDLDDDNDGSPDAVDSAQVDPTLPVGDFDLR